LMVACGAHVLSALSTRDLCRFCFLATLWHG